MEPVETREVGWSVAQAALALLAGFVASQIAINIWAVVQGSIERTLGMTVVGLMGLWSGYLAVMILVSRRRGSGSLVADLRLGIGGWKEVVLGLAGGLGTALILVPALYGVLLRTGIVSQDAIDRLSEPAERLAETAQGPRFVLLALFVGIGAPLVEECLFRGFLQPTLVRRFGAAAGLVLSALIFAAVHFQALQFPALFMFGLVLGALAHFTGRLGASVVAHVVFNGLTLITLASEVT